MISARWFILGIAAIVLGLGVGGLRAPVYADAKITMPCPEVVARYDAFIQDGVEPADDVVPNDAWAAVCRQAIADRKGWAWPATVIGGVVVLGAAVIRRGYKPSQSTPAG